MFRIWADASAISLVAAGILGAFIAPTTGPALAMGMAILMGHTEPVMPELPFPWLFWGATIGAVVVCKILADRSENPARKRGWRVAELVSAVACVVIPLVQVWRLVRLAVGP